MADPTRTVWVDLTTSLASKAVTGTVRAELEIARALRALDPAVRFFRSTDEGFRALALEEISWLAAGDNPLDGFLTHVVKKGAATSVVGRRAERLLAAATKYSDRPYDRLRIGTILLAGLLPARVASLLLRMAQPFVIGARQTARALGSPSQRAADDLAVADAPAMHPFRRGDLVFSAGIDWFSSSITWLHALRETMDLEVVWLIHDVTPIVVPHFHTAMNETLYTEFFRLVSNTCALILYSSKSTQADGNAVQHHLGLPPTSSAVIRLGSRPPAPTADSDAKIDDYLRSIGVVGDFIAFVSTIEVRKNHETLYRAYRQLLLEHGDALPQLVFAGAPGWKTKDFRRMLEQDELVKGKLVVVTPDELGLDAIYRRCLFTVYPSLYEGWGLPIVESLAYGKFIVASRNTSLPEAGECWPDYIDDAWDVDAWSRAIERYAFDREALRQKTEAIANQYQPRSWDACGREIAANLAAVMARRHEDATGRTTAASDSDGEPQSVVDETAVRDEQSA